METVHPVTIYKGRVKAIGIAGILIALYVIGYGGFNLYVAGYNSSSLGPTVYAFPVVNIAAGLWFLVTAHMAIAAANPAGHRPNRGGAVAILASLFALGVAIFQIIRLVNTFEFCKLNESICRKGYLVPAVLLAILLLVQFIISIAHAVLSCGKRRTLSLAISLKLRTEDVEKMETVHPVTIYKGRVKAIGVVGIFIALYVIGYAGYNFHLAVLLSAYSTSAIYAFPIVTIAAGVWFLVTAYMAIAAANPAGHRPDRGGAVAVIASLFALGVGIFQIVRLVNTFEICNMYGSRCRKGLLVPEVLLAILLLVQFIMSIAHAVLSCGKRRTLTTGIPMTH